MMIEKFSNFIPFDKEHLVGFEPNDLTEKNYIEFLNESNDFNLFSLLRNGALKVVAGYKEDWDNVYSGFIICSKNITAFEGSHIRDTLYLLFDCLNMDRFHTISMDNEKLNRWHNFIGFNCDGILRKYKNGNDYRVWSIVKWE